MMKILAVLTLVNVSTLIEPPKVNAQAAVSFQLFYDQLSPYGNWVSYPNYGYVWLPSAGPGFTPYATAGHWVFTDFGWTWVSDYPWGWAPFHYGRWLFDPMYGWIWVPDTVWGPAWVVWRGSPGYYGWAPLRPGVSISMSFGNNYYVPNDWWVFCPATYISSPVVYQHYVPKSNNVTIINNTTVINKTFVDNKRHVTYAYGPDREQVQKNTGKIIKSTRIEESDKPGQSLNNGELKIYRPQVEKSTAREEKPAPKKVTDLKNVNTSAQKDANKKQDNMVPAKAPDKSKTQPAYQEKSQKEQPNPVKNPGQQENRKVQSPDPPKPKQDVNKPDERRNPAPPKNGREYDRK